MKERIEDETIYVHSKREMLLDDDAMRDFEDAFMEGYTGDDISGGLSEEERLWINDHFEEELI